MTDDPEPSPGAAGAGPQPAAPRRSWAPFLAVEAGTALSGIGNGITIVALPWLVLERTGSATLAGVLAAVTAVPTMLAALLSGTIVDRIGRRKVSVVSDVLSLISVALIPLVDVTLGLDFTWLLVLAIMGAVFDPAGMGARESMVPEAAQAARLTLSRANGIHEAIWGGAYVIGPAAGGLLIALIGAATTFWVTAVMFAASALAIALVRIPGGDPPEEKSDAGFWRSTGEGIAFVWHDRLLRTLAILMMVLVGFWLPIEGVLLPVFYEARDAPGELGLVLMALSLGAIFGSLAYGAIGDRLGTRRLFLVALVLTGVGVVAMSTLPPAIAMAIFATGTGFFFGPVQPIMNVAMQTRAPSRLRGRVVGMLTAVQYAAGPFGFLLAGPLVDAVGIEWAFPIIALLLMLVCLAAIPLASLHELDGLNSDEMPPLEETQPPRPLS